MNKKIVIAIIGKSGAGKDTFAYALTAVNNWNFITLSTTRPPRDYEVNGNEYYFLNNEDFRQKLIREEILAHKVFNDWHYGIDVNTLVDGVNVVVISPGGLHQLWEYAENHDDVIVLSYYLWVHDRVRIERQLRRECAPDIHEICRRFLADEDDFKPYRLDPDELAEKYHGMRRFVDDDGTGHLFMAREIQNDVQQIVSSWTEVDN